MEKEPIQVFNFQSENNPKIKDTTNKKVKNKEILVRKQRILINQKREKRFIRFSWKPKSLCNNKSERERERERERVYQIAYLKYIPHNI